MSGRPRAFCTYYDLMVAVLESPEFAFTCERMNFENECPPDCPHYSAIPQVVLANVR